MSFQVHHFVNNSLDVKEHPSLSTSKENINSTKQRYQKYVNNKRSASRGVFEYSEPVTMPE